MFLVLFLFFTLAIAFLYHLNNRNQVFKRIGIPGPEPKLLFGNIFDVFGEHNVQPLQLQKWTKQYGPVYGFLDGGRPMLVISDPDMLQEIMVKKFDYFHGRKEFALQLDPDSNDERVDMFMSRGARWKRLRVISNPTFTAAKIKQMVPKVHSCIKEALDILEEKRISGKSFDIFKVYQALTMDVIGRVAFAEETAVQRDENNELLKLGNGLFRRQRGLILFLPTILPIIRPLVFAFALATARLRKVEWVFLHERMEKLVEAKRKEKRTLTGSDFIELLLNAEADPNDIMDVVSDGTSGSMKALNIKKKLTTGEIASQSFLFLLAGYETTSTAMAYVTFFLAKYPEVQERLMAEIDEHFSEGQEMTYESVHKLEYLDSVINETLRLLPLASPVVSRTCMTSCTVKGVHIPKGVTILADVWSMHHDEDLWGPDAKEFKPERFMPDSLRKPSHPFAYLPFGGGPRICIGMRFALLELKLALCSILMQYRFKWTPQTEDPLQLRFTEVTLAPRHGLYVALEKRK